MFLDLTSGAIQDLFDFSPSLLPSDFCSNGAIFEADMFLVGSAVDWVRKGAADAAASHLKNGILVKDRGVGKILTGGILKYSEDLDFASSKDIGSKDFLR